MTDLLPCPFCGSRQIHVMFCVRGERGAVCICGQCGIRQTSSGKTEAEAIAAWNTRQPTTAPGDDALVEELAWALCRSDWPQQEIADRQFSDELLRAIYDKYARAILPIIRAREAAAHAAGVAKERAAVVSWLREKERCWLAASDSYQEAGDGQEAYRLSSEASAYGEAARHFERGQHKEQGDE